MASTPLRAQARCTASQVGSTIVSASVLVTHTRGCPVVARNPASIADERAARGPVVRGDHLYRRRTRGLGRPARDANGLIEARVRRHDHRDRYVDQGGRDRQGPEAGLDGARFVVRGHPDDDGVDQRRHRRNASSRKSESTVLVIASQLTHEASRSWISSPVCTCASTTGR